MAGMMDTVWTLAHGGSGMMVAILAMASVAGFIAGMLFERASKHSHNEEK